MSRGMSYPVRIVFPGLKEWKTLRELKRLKGGFIPAMKWIRLFKGK